MMQRGRSHQLPASQTNNYYDEPISALMKSLLHPYVSNLMGTSGGRYLAITATVTTFTVGSILAQEYEQTNMIAPDDPFDVQMPSVDEDVTIAGFQLRVDRTKWGVELNPGNHGLLGQLHGDDVNITVTEVSRSQGEAAVGASSTHRERVFTSHAVPRPEDRLRRKAISLHSE
jgi:hypothetical protein